ncbi:hypothetical protein [Acinetobacter baumannii]
MATKRRTQTQWQQLIEQWKQTDETIANFCVQYFSYISLIYF